MKYKCIIFDCDGVLVDSETISSGTLADLARPYGLDISYELAFKQFAGKPATYIFSYIEGKIGHRLPGDFEKLFREQSFKAFEENLQPIEGIHALINRLNIPFCVASSGPMEKIKRNLTTTNLIDKFVENIFSAYQIQKWKPEPDLFLHAARTMGFAPHECAVVEDSISGVEAGIAGGFDVYAFVGKGHENIFEKYNVTVFYSVDELDQLWV